VENELEGPLGKTMEWRKNLLKEGMKGFIQYKEEKPVGFVEYMPAENVPLPIKAPGAAALMCFHWVKPSMSEEEHLESERKLVEKAVDATSEEFNGLAALAWDHPIHFPISMMKDMGFREIKKDSQIHLVWYPHTDAEPPEMIKASFEPRHLSGQGLLAIDQAFSNRCPFSIHNALKFRSWIEEIDDQRIRHHINVIDTREDVFKYSVSPWGWEWIYINGKPLKDIFHLSKEEMINTIKEELERL